MSETLHTVCTKVYSLKTYYSVISTASFTRAL